MLHLPLLGVVSPLIKVELRSKYYDNKLEIMLLLPLVGKGEKEVRERSGKDIKSKDDDDTQIL